MSDPFATGSESKHPNGSARRPGFLFWALGAGSMLACALAAAFAGGEWLVGAVAGFFFAFPLLYWVADIVDSQARVVAARAAANAVAEERQRVHDVEHTEGDRDGCEHCALRARQQAKQKRLETHRVKHQSHNQPGCPYCAVRVQAEAVKRARG